MFKVLVKQRMFIRARKLAGLYLCVIPIISCVVPTISTANGESEPSVDKKNTEQALAQQLYASNQCGDGKQASASWITDRASLKRVYESLQKNKIGGPGLKVPPIDFMSSGVLLINMGQQRTGGYGIKLLDKFVGISKNIATVKLHWLEPSPGGIQIQMLTSPCVLIELGLNNYSHIKVLDQQQVIRYELAI